MLGSCFAGQCCREAARRFRLSLLPWILGCVAVPNPSCVPNPPWPSAEVWVKVGPDQGHAADGTEEAGDGMFLGQSLCIPRGSLSLSPNTSAIRVLLPMAACPPLPAFGQLHIKKQEQNFDEA